MPCKPQHTPLAILLLAMFTLLGTILQCTSPAVAQAEQEAPLVPNRRSLMNQLGQSDSFLVVYNDLHEEAYEELVAGMQLEVGQGRQLAISIQKASQVTMSDVSRFPTLLIGSWTGHALIQALKDQLPLGFDEEGLEFAGKHYPGSDIVFKLFPFPNPENDRMPLFLITGKKDLNIIQFLQSYKRNQWSGIFWQSWGYELYEKGKAQVLGYLSDTTWQVEKEIHFEFAAEEDTIASSKHFTFINQQAQLTATQLAQLKTDCEAQYQKTLSFTGQKDPQLKIPYHLYPSSERKGLRIKNTHETQVDFAKGEVHVVESPWFGGSNQHVENQVLLRQTLGTPKWRPLELGLSIYLNENWFGTGAKVWANKLHHAGFLPNLKALEEEKWGEDKSDLVQGVSAATFVNFLLQHWGKEQFLKRYKKWEPNGTDSDDLATAWEQFKAESFNTKVATREKTQLPYCKGFNFAHEGYRIYNGYGSALALQSLERLQQLNSNSIGIVPYSFMRDPNQASEIPIVGGPGMENDESIIFSHYHAKALGMTSMLKPQIWLGRSWPGDVSFDTEEAWQTFFVNYSKWMIHYAMIAEMHQMDLLCVGVEFVKATIQRPADWRRLIASIREVYSGPITYAANWGEEFEQLSFWEDLDYIGLNCYYPLGKGEKVNKKELNKAFKSIIKKAEKISRNAQKPLLLTEIGFRSIQGPWENPHAQADGRGFNEDHQEWCYDTVFKTIQDEDWIHGIFWWKWPSYLNYRGRENTSFTPNGKKAEETVQRYFAKLK